MQSNRLPARIVLEVQQEGSARKLIIVRSALVVLNKLDSPIELKMENTDEKGDGYSLKTFHLLHTNHCRGCHFSVILLILV